MSSDSSYWDYYEEEYYGMPRWGWGVIALVVSLILLVGIIGVLSRGRGGGGGRKDEEAGDEETGNMKVPTVPPPQTPSPSPTPHFPRDKPLPPPVPSETSEIPVMQ